MVKVTYKQLHPSDPAETEVGGRSFKAGEALDLDGRVAAHKGFIEQAKGNPWFEVDGQSQEQAAPGSREPETPEEYRAYALDWINKAKNSRLLQRRWDGEAEMRERVGWGVDDQHLIDPLYEPKLEGLKNAERD